MLPRPSPHSVNPVTAPLSPRRLRRSVPPSPEMTDRLSGTRQSSTRLTRPAVATATAPWVRSGAPCCPCEGRPATRRSLASEERPLAARASRRQGTPPKKKRTAARRRDDTGGPIAPRGPCSIYNEGRPARRSAIGTVSCECLPARARRPTPGRSRVAATPLTALGQPGDRSTLSSQATSQRSAVTGDDR